MKTRRPKPASDSLPLLSAALITAMGCSGAGYYSHAYPASAVTTTATEVAPPPPAPDSGDVDSTAGETYEALQEHDFQAASQDAMATFSLDVDTASYTIMRRDLRAGRLPRPDSVRPEEYINFFRYPHEAQAAETNAPFSIALEAGPSPFGQGHQLLRVGVEGRTISQEERRSANLVFLVDVSGSMNAPNKLPLVQYSLSTLVDGLHPSDTIGIVVYAGRQAVVLPPTPVAERGRIIEAIASLHAGGSTNAEAGIRTAYDLAAQYARPDGNNRVILCTDGDFNVGLRGEALFELIEEYRSRGIMLSGLGFGQGNYHDHHMEELTNRGNGNYAYIDSQNEALRVLQRDLSGTLEVIAQDVKVQVVFNPEAVTQFRLLGYENRRLAHEDFTDDAVDATEIGSGQFATAFFEFAMQDSVPGDTSLGEVRVRYKEPGSDSSIALRRALTVADIRQALSETSPAFRFGAAVAEFAEVLRESRHVDLGQGRAEHLAEIGTLARDARWSSSDADEFIELVSQASQIRQ